MDPYTSPYIIPSNNPCNPFPPFPPKQREYYKGTISKLAAGFASGRQSEAAKGNCPESPISLS